MSNSKAGRCHRDPIVIESSDEEEDTTSDNKHPTEPQRKRARTDQRRDRLVDFSGTRKFCLILIVEPDDEFRYFLRECQGICSPSVQECCFQREGTLHFTLFDKKPMTRQQALVVSFDSSRLPLPTMELTGFKNWPNCVALGTNTSLNAMISGISPRMDVPKNLHLSLYRLRTRWNSDDGKKRKVQFDRVRDRVKRSFGKAIGVRMILKEMGADYFGNDVGSFFRIIV